MKIHCLHKVRDRWFYHWSILLQIFVLWSLGERKIACGYIPTLTCYRLCQPFLNSSFRFQIAYWAIWRVQWVIFTACFERLYFKFEKVLDIWALWAFCLRLEDKYIIFLLFFNLFLIHFYRLFFHFLYLLFFCFFFLLFIYYLWLYW